MQLLQNIGSFAREKANSPAISASGTNPETLSYGDFTFRVTQLERLLSSEVGEEDFVFVLAGRTTSLACCIVAGLQAGRPLAIIDPRLGNHRISQLLAVAKNSFGLVDPLGEQILANIPADQLAGVRFRSISEAFKSDKQATPKRIIHNLNSSSETAVILFTSGSTGAPKGVRISYADLDRRLETEIRWFEMSSFDQILGVLPLSFDVGLTQLLATLYSGGHHVLLHSWLPRDLIEAIDKFSAQGLALSPVLWKNLLRFSDKDLLWSRLNTLRYMTLSGGTVAAEDLSVIAENLKSCDFIKTYGQTEMFRIAALKVRETPEKLHSVGRAYPGVKIEIRDENGILCGPDEVGEVVASGDGLMLGYLSGTEGAPNQIFTGDQGLLDSQGFLHLKGRKDDMVKILDQRVYPDDVANNIREITGISDVVVTAENVNGEKQLVTFILADGLARLNMTERDFLRVLRQELGSHLVPSRVIELNVFPHTISGKIDKIALRSIFSDLGPE